MQKDAMHRRLPAMAKLETAHRRWRMEPLPLPVAQSWSRSGEARARSAHVVAKQRAELQRLEQALRVAGRVHK